MNNLRLRVLEVPFIFVPEFDNSIKTLWIPATAGRHCTQARKRCKYAFAQINRMMCKPEWDVEWIARRIMGPEYSVAVPVAKWTTYLEGVHYMEREGIFNYSTDAEIFFLLAYWKANLDRSVEDIVKEARCCIALSLKS